MRVLRFPRSRDAIGRRTHGHVLQTGLAGAVAHCNRVHGPGSGHNDAAHHYETAKHETEKPKYSCSLACGERRLNRNRIPDQREDRPAKTQNERNDRRSIPCADGGQKRGREPGRHSE